MSAEIIPTEGGINIDQRHTNPDVGTYYWFVNQGKAGAQWLKEHRPLASNIVGLGLYATSIFHPITAHAEATGDSPGDPVDTVPLDGTTPTSTRMPRALVPTFTPTPRATPEVAPTPTSKPLEIPIVGSEIGKPSANAKAFALMADTRFRIVPSTEGNDPVVQRANTIYIETGHTIDMTDGTWKEVVVNGQILFVRADVVNAQSVSGSKERLQYAQFADTAPITSTLTSVADLTKSVASQGGATEEADAANTLINNFWGGEGIATKALSNPYDALRKNLAIAATAPLGFFETGGIKTFTYMGSDGNPIVIGPNINGGFTLLRTNRDEFKNVQAELISITHWNSLVDELGLQQAQEVARRMNAINFRIFETTVDGKAVIKSPDGHEAVTLYLNLTGDPRFDDGKPGPQPVATATPTRTPVPPPTARATPVPPTATPAPPTQLAEGEEGDIKYYESKYTTPDGITRKGHTVNIGNLRITTDNQFIQHAFETTANDIYGNRQPDKAKNTFIDLNPDKQDATNRAMGLTDLVRSHLNQYHINTGASYEAIIQAFMRGEIPLHIILLPPSGMTRDEVLEKSTTRGGSEAPHGLPFLELNSGFFGVGSNQEEYTMFFSPLLTDQGKLVGRGDEADFLSEAFGAAAEISKFGDRFSIGADKTDYSDKFIELFYYDISSNPDSPFSFSPLQK